MNAIGYLPTRAPNGRAANDCKPTVDMPAVYTIGSDDYAGKIIEVRANGRTLVWERGSQLHVFTLRRDGRYLLRGCNHGRLTLGDDSPTELDPSF